METPVHGGNPTPLLIPLIEIMSRKSGVVTEVEFPADIKISLDYSQCSFDYDV